MIHLLAYFTAKPGHRDAILREFAKIVPLVRAEKGCIQYEAAVDTPGLGGEPKKLGPDSFVVVEQWASVADLEVHAEAPHTRAFFDSVQPIVANQTVHLLTPV